MLSRCPDCSACVDPDDPAASGGRVCPACKAPQGGGLRFLRGADRALTIGRWVLIALVLLAPVAFVALGMLGILAWTLWR